MERLYEVNIYKFLFTHFQLPLLSGVFQINKKIAKVGLSFRLGWTQYNSSRRRFKFSELQEGCNCGSGDQQQQWGI
jgi:hypothetical protein